LAPEGREFVVSGFSMVRRGSFLHWYLVGGEVFSQQEWETLVADPGKIDPDSVDPYKRLFLSESREENGDSVGAPVSLEGTTTAMRTIVAGEFDLISGKHSGRCYMQETENNFGVICDDPDVFERLSDASKRTQMINIMRDRVEGAAAMWNLAEAMFELPAYFAFKVQIAKSIAVSGGQRLAATTPKGGRGLGAHFRYVSTIEYMEDNPTAIRAYTVPHYEVETEGYWRRLPPNQQGRDADGNAVRGRTWIKASNKWRERPDSPKIIYVKASVSTAKLRLSEYLAATKNRARGGRHTSTHGVLYVLRCMGMADEVYKVGWTSGTAEQRAKELSSATGVPSAFVVVEAWEHADPEGLEKSVHAMLSPYRVSDAREFFQVKYATIRRIVEAEIARWRGSG
jgi:T5orf172 domain